MTGRVNSLTKIGDTTPSNPGNGANGATEPKLEEGGNRNAYNHNCDPDLPPCDFCFGKLFSQGQYDLS